MANVSDERDFCESKFTEIVDKCLKDFPNIEALRFEQTICPFNLRDKQNFSIISSCYKSTTIL